MSERAEVVFDVVYQRSGVVRLGAGELDAALAALLVESTDDKYADPKVDIRINR
jgi:hypothetical protein